MSSHSSHKAEPDKAKADEKQEKPVYETAIDEITAGAKKLTESGLGASSAGELAMKLWLTINGK